MSEIHKKILEQANAAITRGDFEGFLAHCTDDTKWTFVGDRTLEGKDAVREWMKSTYRQPPKFQLHQMVSEDGFLAAIGEITLKDEAGKPTQNSYCDVWRFRGDKLAGLRAYVVAKS